MEKKLRKKTVKTLFMFSNGNFAITDQFGQQIAELQTPMENATQQKILDRAIELGYKIDTPLEVYGRLAPSLTR